MVDFLEKYALRSFRQVLIHVAVAIVLCIVLSVTLGNQVSISTESFVSIVSSIAAASGALLAVTLALLFFFARHVMDSRDKLFEKLIQGRKQLREQIEKSARFYPEISRRLSALYDKSIRYIPGQPIDMKEVRTAGGVFQDWAIEQVKGKTKPIDLGDPAALNSFELHLRDAQVCKSEVTQTFAMLDIAHNASRTIPTFTPLIIGWVIILIVSSIFAIIGSTEAITASLRFSTLIIPFYLLVVAVFALVRDIVAIVSVIRAPEIGYEKAMVELAIKSVSNGEHADKDKGK